MISDDLISVELCHMFVLGMKRMREELPSSKVEPCILMQMPDSKCCPCSPYVG